LARMTCSAAFKSLVFDSCCVGVAMISWHTD